MKGDILSQDIVGLVSRPLEYIRVVRLLDLASEYTNASSLAMYLIDTT